MTMNWPASTVFSAPVTISRAFSGILRADLPELGDMQILQRAGAHRGGDADRAVVGEGEGVGAVLHGRAGCLQPLVELVVGVLDLVAEDDLGVVELVGDDAGAGVGREDAGVEIDQAAERGEAELPGLEDDVGRVQLVEEVRAARSFGRNGTCAARPCR